jgi:gamma-glutamylcysteine synthetase
MIDSVKPLDESAERRETPTEELLRKYHGRWGCSVYTEYAY